ncbi:HET-domain-containing protein [Microthyrium microscopicum]|uniref:HET-domain-containing protein n=1 Tax=Microthyrium microscopicum TaxID=703497 RepID=A0A6A6URI4_9PEZI|nr:HET-domain-containing protein [Microthyrium microscopicum]
MDHDRIRGGSASQTLGHFGRIFSNPRMYIIWTQNNESSIELLQHIPNTYFSLLKTVSKVLHVQQQVWRFEERPRLLSITLDIGQRPSNHFMWLINSKSIQLEWFYEDNAPKYAILSHTWGEDEFLYDDIRNDRGKDKLGFQKVQYCCEQALKDGLSYCWVDTCSIDKSSSSELSEAINSMFRWYSQATVCYAYLSDVPDTAITVSDGSFRLSRWFTRGWTLQELIAPPELVFYTSDWKRFKSRKERKTEISEVTGIIESALDGDLEAIYDFSIAQKMYWASNRTTTRPEDMAYCLMGLFNVHIPLLYGEGGENAFTRLQEELLKTSDDQSLLAWDSGSDMKTSEMHGLLARSPQDFRNSRDFVGFSRLDVSSPPTMTNKGIRLTTQMITCLNGPNTWAFWAILDCRNESSETDTVAGVMLQRTYPNSEQCARVCAKIGEVDFSRLKASRTTQTVYVRKRPMKHASLNGSTVTFQFLGLDERFFKEVSCYPELQVGHKSQDNKISISRQHNADIPDVPWWKLEKYNWHSVLHCKLQPSTESKNFSEAIYIVVGYDSKEKKTWSHLICTPISKSATPRSAKQVWEVFNESPKHCEFSAELQDRTFNKNGIRQSYLSVDMQNLADIHSTKGARVTMVYVSLLFEYSGDMGSLGIKKILSWKSSLKNEISKKFSRDKSR